MTKLPLITNFIPLSRKVFQHDLWTEKRQYSKFEAWLDLLATARYETTEGSMLIGNKIITWNRGELVASQRFLGVRWGWSKKKVMNFIVLLKDQGMIATRVAKEAEITIVTICKYDIYNTKKTSWEPAWNHLGTSTEPDENQLGITLEPDGNQHGTKTNIDKIVNTENTVNTEKKGEEGEVHRAFAHLSITVCDFNKLLSLGYARAQVNEILDAIENFSENKKYTSLYLTAKKWLELDKKRAPPPRGFEPPAPSPQGRINTIAGAFSGALKHGGNE